MTRRSILLVTVDCLRSDHVGFMGYSRPTTPFLDSLAAESFVFPAAIVAGAPTYYSLPAILASRYPLSLGRDVVGLAPGEPTLASVLKASGYATACVSAANPYISARFGCEQGFDTFRDFLDAEPASGSVDGVTAPTAANGAANNGWAAGMNRALQKARPALGPLGAVYDELYFRYCERVTPVPKSLDALRRFPAADAIVDEASRWLDSIGETPFFLWLHFMDPHSPYYPVPSAVAAVGDNQVTPAHARYLNSFWNRSDLGPSRLAAHRDEIVALYDAGIRWVDTQLHRLIDYLRQSRRWNDCIFSLSADHGEEFLDHGGRYHPPSRLMEELIHVPLLLRVPDVPKKQLPKSPFSMLHLAPTLLDAADQPSPAEFQGASYWPQIRDGIPFESVAISECVRGCTNPLKKETRLGPRIFSVRDARYKLLLHFDPSAELLYDLESDPGEQAPLAPLAQKPVLKRLLETAREHLQRSTNNRNRKAWVRARLRALRQDKLRPETERAHA
jgi:arylsulfatase A-like enzyme